MIYMKAPFLKECPIKKGAFCFWGSVWVRVPSVPEKAVCRSFVFQLKSGPEKPRKRPIGCAFTRIRSKLTIIDGGGGESRTPVRKRFGAGVSECSLSFRIPLTQRRQTGYALRYPLIHHRTQGTVRWRSPLIDARSGAVVLSGRTAAFSYAASATLLSLAFNFKFGVMKESRLLLAAHASTSPSKPLRPHKKQHQCCLSARSMVRWAAFFAASARLS